MRLFVYNPSKSGEILDIVCFISGSGTNYREIVKRNPKQHYLVFTNRPGCSGELIAQQNQHEIIELSHIPYLKEAKIKYGPGKVPRNCAERIAYEQAAVRLIENKLGKQPDLICLAGYDQWNSDWFVEQYYPRILNVHPGDTTKGYIGLHWISAAKAILAGDQILRSTLFFVNKSEDNGPVLVQSAPLNIKKTLGELESQGKSGLLAELQRIIAFSKTNRITDYELFKEKAGAELSKMIELVCINLQDTLKIAGDWKIYPFAVHDLIAAGRVEIDDTKVYVDGKVMPQFGFRIG